MAETENQSQAQAKPKQEEFWGDTQRRMRNEFASLESKLSGIDPSTTEGMKSMAKFIDDAYGISLYHGLKARGKAHELRRKHVDGILSSVPTPDEHTAEKLTDQLIESLKAADKSLSLLPFYHPDRWARKRLLRGHVTKHVNGLYSQASSLYGKLTSLAPAEEDTDLTNHKQELGQHVSTLKEIVDRLVKYSTLNLATGDQKRDITYNIGKIKHRSVESLLQQANKTINDKQYERASLYLEKAKSLVDSFWPEYFHLPKEEYTNRISELKKRIPAAPAPAVPPSSQPAPTAQPAQ